MDTKPTVLIVDDSSANLDLVEAVLNKDYNLLSTTSGHEAIQLAQEERPHLILLDIMMPEIDGFETAKIIKKNPVTAEIPIVFLTSKKEVESIVKGFEIGGVDYITKPFITPELKARVKTHVQKRQRYLNLGKLLQAQGENLKKANAVLKVFNESKDTENNRERLIDNIAFYIKTPLNSILGYAEAMMGLTDDDDLKDLAFIVLEETKNLSDVIDNILGITDSK